MNERPLADRETEELQAFADRLRARLDQLRNSGLALDLTRGKPAPDQLSLSDALDGILAGDYLASDGTDTRNYGGLRGIPEARALGAEILGLEPDQVIAGGNSSLMLMYVVIEAALRDGLWSGIAGWAEEAQRTATPVRMLTPVPGYDRHFTICDRLGIEMINVPMTASGPDLETIDRLMARDPMIKGIWCVPKYSNPTGCVYSDAVVEHIAGLPARGPDDFLVMWDNAYAVHDLGRPVPLANVLALAATQGTAEHVAVFGSTSKITFAGAGVGFLGGAEPLLAAIEKRLQAMTVGHDKVNQLRHARFLEGRLSTHMAEHASLIRGKFEAVSERLTSELGGLGVATWTEPQGGYFVSLDTLPGLASRVVELAAGVGVRLTPAGATYPYGRDPEDKNIRIAPTFPALDELEAAIEVLTLCIQLASAERIIEQRSTS